MKALLRILAFAILGAAASGPARADDYPSKPIRYIAIFPPGGPTDILARLIAPKLGEALGQPVIVENRPGAAGSVGASILAKSPADGYTIGAGTVSSHGSNATLYKRLAYDPVTDFAPIAMLATLPYLVVVSPRLNVHSVSELIALLKANPDKYSFGSGGNGTSEHLSGELFKNMTGTRMQHVPYKGSGQLLPDLISGAVPIGFVNMLAVYPHVKSGQLAALAVTSPERTSTAPEIPTLAESGLAGYDMTGWQALFAPAGTPKAIVARLHAEVAKILRDPEVVKRIRDLGGEPGAMTPEQLADLVRRDIPRLGKIVKASGAQLD